MDEELQIKLLAEEYRAQGYQVRLDAVVPALDIRADILAIRSDDKVCVEVANRSNRPPEVLLERAHRMANALSNLPGWRIEFRFFEETADQLRSRTFSIDLPEISGQLRGRLLSRRSQEPARVSQIALADWWLWVRGVRSLAARSKILQSTGDVADLAEDLMSFGVLRRHPKIEHAIICERMQAAFEGQTVPSVYASALRWLVLDLRIALRSKRRLELLDKREHGGTG
jgi:hypothetical protein